ncbi:MAG TPA: hypothetical protein PLB01_02390 [Thermoanaerobaculia bacterium]|nr:hypothetical protein [Thermoanaerobaculia bacterium]
MSRAGSESVQSTSPSQSAQASTPDFATIVKEKRSPVVLIFTALAALAAAVLFFLARGGS